MTTCAGSSSWRTGWASAVALVGNPVGGFGAAHIAMRSPDRVHMPALISPATTFHSIVPFYTHMFVPKAAYLLPWVPGRRAVMRRRVDWAYAGLPSDGPWGDLFLLNMSPTGRRRPRLFPWVYIAEELRRIRARTLLMIGDRERSTPPARPRRRPSGSCRGCRSRSSQVLTPSPRSHSRALSPRTCRASSTTYLSSHSDGQRRARAADQADTDHQRR
jgi:pimeloyl-ACP methyl ester carboxylesterase